MESFERDPTRRNRFGRFLVIGLVTLLIIGLLVYAFVFPRCRTPREGRNGAGDASPVSWATVKYR